MIKADFSPGKSYHERLKDTMLCLDKNVWFNIDGRKDYDKIVLTLKKLIDDSWPFEFSEDYKKIRRITNFEL